MPHQQLTQGIVIALEGIDGSGKSTLANNLFTLLQKKQFDVLLTREPGATALGKEIREIIQHQTIPLCGQAQYLLFAADRAQHFAEVIIPHLQEKKLILSDRMADSSLAYQCYGNGLDLAMVRAINKWTMNGITPNITIFVRIPVAIALERAKNRGALSAYEKQEAFLHKVADGFEELYKNRSDVIIVDGTQTQESLTYNVYNAIEQWIQSKNLIF
jgi:dTMP kinase